MTILLHASMWAGWVTWQATLGYYICIGNDSAWQAVAGVLRMAASDGWDEQKTSWRPRTVRS